MFVVGTVNRVITKCCYQQISDGTATPGAAQSNHSVGMEHGGGTWDLETFGLKDNGWHIEATFSCSAVNQHDW